MHSYTILSIFGLVASTSAHMKMSNPMGWFVNNSPLRSDGLDFPCKGVDYSAAAEMNTYQQGQSAPLTFIGQAVHGGGSCQVSLTTDLSPTKDSVWRVIKSIEGGCPAQGETGNMGENAEAEDPYKYEFIIPDDVPAGQYTIAWTWFNKIGNREMYMNCGPATIQGEGGSQSAFDSLPVMFTANIGNGCETKHGTDVEFPNPGKVVERLNGVTDVFSAPTGSCQSDSGDGDSSAIETSVPTAAPTATPEQNTKTPEADTEMPEPESTTLPGGVFIETPASTPTTTVGNGGSTPEPTKPAALPVQEETPAEIPAESGNMGFTGSGSEMAAGIACEVEGFWNCIGGMSFQRCASGIWSSAMPLAKGTTCSGGISENIDIQRRGVTLKAPRGLGPRIRI